MSAAQAPTVLVVEDDPAVRELVVELLRAEGYATEEAQDGADAIRALREHRPPPERLCLVLLDMMLPKVDGLDVLHALAGLGAYVPVVAMSASRERLTAAIAAGARAAVPKPFDVDRLLAVVGRNCSG